MRQLFGYDNFGDPLNEKMLINSDNFLVFNTFGDIGSISQRYNILNPSCKYIKIGVCFNKSFTDYWGGLLIQCGQIYTLENGEIIIPCENENFVDLQINLIYQQVLEGLYAFTVALVTIQEFTSYPEILPKLTKF